MFGQEPVQQGANKSKDDPQHQQLHDAPAQEAKKPADGGIDRNPGGKDSLGKKENLLSPFFDEMVEVANALAPQFVPYGLHFRPEILLATAMQEAANKDPLNNRSFDNGLGIMQITPYKGKLDAAVARSIGWDNDKDVEYNIQHSRWRDAKANLTAGAQTMLGKARSIKGGVAHTWEQMDEAHRWRAVLFAYNAGEGAAINALRHGGPNATMISTFTYKGKKVSHDYTAEIKEKMDYVEGHDPFHGDGPAKEDPQAAKDKQQQDKPPGNDHEADKPQQDQHPLAHSVGANGKNDKKDVRAVQTRLKERGLDPGPVDGAIGAHTIAAIKEFQASFMAHPDGLIEPGHGTEKHLFQESGIVHPQKQATTPRGQDGGGTGEHAGGPKVVEDHLSHVRPGVKLTEPIVNAFKVLQPYLPAGAVMTSGLRTDEDQANLIHRYYHDHHGPASVQDAEGQRQWLKSNYHMIIAAVGSSPHRTGLAFDLSGAPIDAINAAVHRCKAEKGGEFHLKDTIVERANNCIHVDLTG